MRRNSWFETRSFAALLTMRSKPFQSAPSRRRAGGERGLQQIAAGWRFPVEHFAGGEDAGQPADHEIGVEFIKRYPARSRDRTRDRRHAIELDRHGVDQSGKTCG